MKSHEYAKNLREVAAALEAAPEFLLPSYYECGFREKYGIDNFAYYSDKNNFLAAVKAIPQGRKVIDGDDLHFVVVGGLLHISINRDAVCRIVKPAQPAEYDCEPLLSQAEEAQLSTP